MATTATLIARTEETADFLANKDIGKRRMGQWSALASRLEIDNWRLSTDFTEFVLCPEVVPVGSGPMEESSHLLHDLGWLMAAAAIASILFRRMKQPAIIGYLAAGLLLGPHLLPSTPISDSANLGQLSELGVLFLMFYIGLEFDLGKLRPVAAASVLALALQTALMMLVGTTVGQWLGWSAVEGLFLGGILAISSSMVCFKLIGERGDMNRPYAQLTAGVLILEDILAIVLLVVLAGVGVSGQLDFAAVGQTTFFVGIFVVAVFLIGKLVAPPAIKFLDRIGNAETLTLFVVGVIFAVSLLAEEADFSLALGSFLAGAIFSRSAVAHEIEGVTAPLRDFFSALFFVTIGTLIEPEALWAQAGPILLVTLIMMTGKFAACWLGFVLAAVPPAVAVRASMAKVQIGEFGFVIAALALSLGLTNPALKAVTTGVAVLSIMLTPVAFGVCNWVISTANRRSHQGVHTALKVYLNWVEALQLTLRSSSFLRVVKRPLVRVGIDFLLLSALIIVASLGASLLEDQLFQQLVWVGAALASIPFLVDILRSLDVVTMTMAEIAVSRPALRFMAQGPAQAVLRMGAFSLIVLGFVSLFSIACSRYFPTGASFTIFVLAIAIMLILGWKRAVKLQSQLEYAVVSSLADVARSGARSAVEDAIGAMTRKHPWPVELLEVEVPAGGAVVGKTIRQLELRSSTGATVVAVQRGGVTHYIVPPDLPLSPDDKLLLVAEAAQLQAAEKLLRQIGDGNVHLDEELPHQFARMLVTGGSALCGLTLREAELRKKYGVSVIGLQREDARITGPSPDECLLDGDLLLVMGPEQGTVDLREALL